jgi:zinc/manganese transport system substrate-binding protein
MHHPYPMKSLLLILTVALGFAQLSTAEIKVIALHPILGDLAKEIAGSKAEVVNLLKPGGDVHHFEPTARDVASMKGAALILASGKGIENFLGNLRDSVPGVPLVEVGRTIPSIKIEPGSELFYCCPDHTRGSIDPHWWHSAENMRRAARIVGDELAKVDPANAAAYKASATAEAAEIAGYKVWAQQQLAQIPRSDRKLVTAHAAFGYFCKEFGFKSIPVLGLSRQDEASPTYITEAVKAIRDNQIKAVFPEDQSNPKVLREIVRETGVKIGDYLVADGTHPEAHTFSAMLRHNVNAIVKALKP